MPVASFPQEANLTVLRRRNALALFQAFHEAAVAQGAAPKGLEQAFAAQVQVSPSMWSQIKSSRPIGDKLARQLEAHCGQAPGWLDEEHEGPTPPDAAEERFLDAARAVWRVANARRKRELMQLIRRFGDA